MATITISDLHPAGSALFSDPESYMTELVDSEIDSINGGIASIILRLAAKSSESCVKATIKITGIAAPKISMFC